MLTNLHVRNFALIDEADIELSEHFNVLTGETGAGKSIILGAINLALGARTNKDVIKTGADYCLAELTFSQISTKALNKATELGISVDDGEITISRKLLASGKSLLRVNGETLNTSTVRELTAELIDIYGQNEHQSLSDSNKQLAVIDRYLRADVNDIKSELASKYEEYISIKKEFENLDNDPASRERRIDLISFELDEIDNASFTDDNEEELLKEEHKKLANSHIILQNLSQTMELINGDDGCSDRLSLALKSLGRVSEFDEQINVFYDTLSDLDSCISDLVESVRNYLDEMPDSSERLLEVEERLDLIAKIKSKYGRNTSQIADYYAKSKAELDKLLSFEQYCNDLERKLKKSEDDVRKLSIQLSKYRQAGASDLQKKIAQGLLELNFNHVVFEIRVNERQGLHYDGIDDIEFMISLNPGEDVRPLAKIASGGELSRIMLAIKSVLAVRDDIGTLIFDEIDTGISGITAQKVADKLAAISGVHQVICITHLSQIAAMADTHLRIKKSADDASTVVDIAQLTKDGMIDELVRLVSGSETTEAIRTSALQIKEAAEERKNAIRQHIDIK